MIMARTAPAMDNDWRDTSEPLEPAAAQRASLLRSPLGLVETLRCRGTRATAQPEGYSAEFQVCLPYHGYFVWHVGDDDVASDANQVLFVTSGQPYRLSDPLPGGYAELILTPAEELLADLLEVSTSRLDQHDLFRRRSRRADSSLQFLRSRFLHATRDSAGDELAREEMAIAILRRALATRSPGGEPSPTTRRLLRRTKEFVVAHLGESLRLDHIARAVGSSPAYLTDIFRRFEGLPLHRYVLQARLARALVELPQAHDLTALALDLGFSSHSHFAAAFRRAFGCTPSAFRESAGGSALRRIA